MDVFIKEPKDTLMRHTVEHAKTTHGIVETISKKMNIPKEAFLIRGIDRACYVGFEGNSNTFFLLHCCKVVPVQRSTSLG